MRYSKIKFKFKEQSLGFKKPFQVSSFIADNGVVNPVGWITTRD